MVSRPRCVSVLLAVVLLALASSASAQALTIQPAVLPNWTQGQTYVPVPLVALSGLIPTPATFAVTSGAMPPGLGLTVTGVPPLQVTTVTGTPTTAGTYGFTLTATDALNRTGTRAYTIVIGAPPTVGPPSILDATLDQPYTQTLTATGGSPPYGWTVALGSLPAGLTLNPLTGMISGTPTQKGSSTFTARATDTALATGDRIYTLKVIDPPGFSVSGDETWTVDRPGFSLTVTASGGSGALTWGTVTGVPPGLTSVRVGDVLTLSGTPTAADTTTLEVTVTDAIGGRGSLQLPIRIAPPISLVDGALLEATVGRPWSSTVAAVDGTPPYAFGTGAVPPAWVSIGGTSGQISGTPSQTDDLSIPVEVTGAAGSTDARSYALVVNAAPAIGTDRLPAGIPGRAYAATLPVAGGTAPFAVAVQNGSLPGGLGFAGLELTGTPTTTGVFEATLLVTDRWGATVARSVTVPVARESAVRAGIPAFDLVAGGQHAWILDVVAGTTLKLKLKVDGLAADLDVRLLYDDGAEVALAPFRRDGKRKVSLKKVPLPRTGRVLLVVGNGASSGMRVSGKIKGTASDGFGSTQPWGPGVGDVTVEFGALAGSRVKIAVKAKGNDVPLPQLVSLTGPGGALPTAARLSVKSSGFKIKKVTTADGGDHVLTFRPGPGGDGIGEVKVTVKIDPPDDYAYTHDAGSGSPLRLTPGETTAVLVDDDLSNGPDAAWVFTAARFEGTRLLFEAADGRAALGEPEAVVTGMRATADLRAGGVAINLSRDTVRIDRRGDDLDLRLMRDDVVIGSATFAARGPFTLDVLRSGDSTRVAVDGLVVIEVSPVTGPGPVALRGDPTTDLELTRLVLSGR